MTKYACPDCKQVIPEIHAYWHMQTCKERKERLAKLKEDA